jgi:hypothetical protein
MLLRRAAAPLLGIVVAAALYPGTWSLDAVAREGQLGPGFWPRLALLGFALASVAKIAEEWRLTRDGRRPRDEVPGPAAIATGRLAAGVALIVAYVVLTPLVGFALTTALFIVAFLWLCGMRSPAAIGLNVVVGTLGLLYVFIKLVYLPLPKGGGPFEELTIALYRVLRVF